MGDICKRFDIVSGPNKDDLVKAFKDAFDKKTETDQVKFDIALGYIGTNNGKAYTNMKSKDFKVTGIEHEDGSGHSFNLKGYCSADIRFGVRDAVIYQPYKFEAYYNAETKKGYITLTKQ